MGCVARYSATTRVTASRRVILPGFGSCQAYGAIARSPEISYMCAHLGKQYRLETCGKISPPQELVPVPAALLGFADFHDDFVDRLLQAVSQRLEVGSYQGVA